MRYMPANIKNRTAESRGCTSPARVLEAISAVPSAITGTAPAPARRGESMYQASSQDPARQAAAGSWPKESQIPADAAGAPRAQSTAQCASPAWRVLRSPAAAASVTASAIATCATETADSASIGRLRVEGSKALPTASVLRHPRRPESHT